MTATTPPALLPSEALSALCVGHDEWHIRRGDGICMMFSHADSLSPEREAIAWLAEHQERYPERFAGYKVERVTVQTELQIAALAVLADLDRLRAEMAALRASVLEEAAKVCDDVRATHAAKYEGNMHAFDGGYCSAALRCAEKIRSLPASSGGAGGEGGKG